jgi:hypothetical protein
LKYNWETMTDDQKRAAVAEELRLVTHMGTTKDDFIEIMKFLNEQNKVIMKALDLSVEEGKPEDCGYCPIAETCQYNETNCLQQLKDYFLQQAQEK